MKLIKYMIKLMKLMAIAILQPMHPSTSQFYLSCVGIVVEAYSPLTKSIKLNDPKLVAIAAKYDVTTAQVVIL